MILQTKSQKLPAFAALGALFTYAVVMTVPEASVNELGREFHVSNSSLGAIFRYFMIGFLIAAVIGGRLSDKYGKLPVLVLGCALMSAGMLMFSYSSVFITLQFAIILAGIGGGLAEVGAMAVISDLYQGPMRTAMMNWSQVVFSAGAVAQPLMFAKLLNSGLGWRMGYIVAALLAILAAFIAAGASFVKGKTTSGDCDEHVSWHKIIRNKTIIQLSCALMLYVGAELGLASWVAVYLKKSLDASAPIAAASVAVFWAGIGIGRIVATRVSMRVSDYALISWAVGLASISMIVLLCINKPTAGLIMIFCVGFPLGPVWPTIISRAGYIFPKQSGTVIGIVASAGCLGAAILPQIIGHVSDSFGIRAALWICFASLILCLTTIISSRKQINTGF